ncbi:bifunctional adenosylcobinamide kinase/adenosylcobinamide-phosphate guanylyltransferase [Cohnella faecalis]|uniref:Uncharacterized protein n=1 Tax=Cohnella faecalis TaxID=2315694 RepID=A0A398CL67_9BACL|nr:bifunctional adenosylcobinamide kinase/adenosylcobinamide-phosphate guanylyltransferase [Cohnella faecalis]RIE04086.1 hypothetical protein D3H35_09080 [Cohnella faecalis]
MMVVVTGGLGNGKSAYADEWAMSLGREAIRLSCPALPYESIEAGRPLPAARPGFVWKQFAADSRLTDKLNEINLESNLFRSESRVVVVDSLSGWLRARIYEALNAGAVFGEHAARVEKEWRKLLEAVFSFQGFCIVVTEDTVTGLALDPWEGWYAGQLARANRALSEASHRMFRMTAGVASEIKGHRAKRERRHERS